MANLLRAEYPNVATDEIRCTEESDEPYLHIDNTGFCTEGLARGCRYVIEGAIEKYINP